MKTSLRVAGQGRAGNYSTGVVSSFRRRYSGAEVVKLRLVNSGLFGTMLATTVDAAGSVQELVVLSVQFLNKTAAPGPLLSQYCVQYWGGRGLINTTGYSWAVLGGAEAAGNGAGPGPAGLV